MQLARSAFGINQITCALVHDRQQACMLARKIEGEKAAEARHAMSNLLQWLEERLHLGKLHCHRLTGDPFMVQAYLQGAVNTQLFACKYICLCMQCWWDQPTRCTGDGWQLQNTYIMPHLCRWHPHSTQQPDEHTSVHAVSCRFLTCFSYTF